MIPYWIPRTAKGFAVAGAIWVAAGMLLLSMAAAGTRAEQSSASVLFFFAIAPASLVGALVERALGWGRANPGLPAACAACQGQLYKPWYDREQGGYVCRKCGHVT
jgi:hypothetical protein